MKKLHHTQLKAILTLLKETGNYDA